MAGQAGVSKLLTAFKFSRLIIQSILFYFVSQFTVLALVQIIIATIVTVVTTTSMIALCTNGDIGGGGIYSMISRSVGHEAGGVIGFLFTFTNAAFVGLNLLGTAESVSDILNVRNNKSLRLIVY